MNALLGRGLVLAALGIAAFGMVLGFTAGRSQSRRHLRWARATTHLFALAMISATLVMLNALLSNDFSVAYVAKVGSRVTPTWVTVASLWSSLEGSILLWAALLAGYGSLFAAAKGDRFHELMGYALGIILGVGSFFAFLLAGPADPFVAMSPVPPDGPGPNPLLQNHFLMAIHPPLLYLGFVGLTVPFAIAMASVLRGQLHDGWMKAMRRWTLAPWLFLTAGIIVGGWWAYEVLGWGGYWAWDPVENASLLPWLAATGYLHAAAVRERRGVLTTWTMTLVVTAFLLTLVGTFMTRSGLFNSVHSFTQSRIGPAFLVFIGSMTVFSLGALVGRGHLFERHGSFEGVLSRETAFLINNLVMVTFTFTVLLGTLYPLVTEAVRGVRVSVGRPYFDQIAVPAGLMIVFLMGVGPALPWGRSDPRAVARGLAIPAGVAFIVVGLCLAGGAAGLLPLTSFGLCAFAAVVTLREMFGPALFRIVYRGEGWLHALERAVGGARRRFGGYVVHLAVLMVVVGVTASSAYRVSTEASLRAGQSMVIGAYELIFRGMQRDNDSHRTAISARIEVRRKGTSIYEMSPALSYYRNRREPVPTPHVETFGHEDLYLTLIEFDENGARAALRAHVSPMVSWLWWSLPLFVLGIVIAFPPHRRARTVVAHRDPSSVEVG